MRELRLLFMAAILVSGAFWMRAHAGDSASMIQDRINALQANHQVMLDTRSLQDAAYSKQLALLQDQLAKAKK